jgi:AacA4 family aminoglycoside N(6')-acetyltransferase
MSSADSRHVALRLMTAEDLPMLHRWINSPHVNMWWGGEPFSMDHVIAHYMPRVMAQDGVTPYIVELDGTPFAYAQSYVVMGHGGGWWEDETDPGARGIDQSIGEAHLLDQGLGTLLVKALVEKLWSDPAVTKIQTDPAPHNVRAIRCYEKAGFRRVKEVITPDGPAVYMLRSRA